MDVLADLLDGVRARGAVFGQAIMNPPWSVRFASGASLSLATMLRGHAWVVPAGGDPVPIRAGDIAIVSGPYTLADDPATPPRYVVTDTDYCPGTEEAWFNLGGRTCGVGTNGSAVLLSGAYEGRGEISERLLGALPEVLVIPDQECHWPILEWVASELGEDRPGQRVVLDRILDLTLINALRAWFDRPGTPVPAWYTAMDDPVVGHALRLLHDDPAHPWTVATLAAKSGVSRAGLARRFTARVGQPPMAYLTAWRIAMAADLLRDTDATVGSIARKVGYANTFALSVAFKRLRGITPTEHRAAAP
ncbi:AraC family transcriptional regulator [Pseudonocardia acaciae]|uniref:AraC family transcriptional regulator n=1 Tax=Pseudonocardia acaciae TaxID=551276 RepID=UPI00048CF862|nr:AraC family transcriptional regulator [Pseudonocardia acaciae]